MSGIYIPGMEMPKNCHECPLLYVTSLCDGLRDCPWADEAMEYIMEMEDDEDD